MMTREECVEAAEALANAASRNATARPDVAQAQATAAAVFVALAAMRDPAPKPPVADRDWLRS